MVRQARPGLTRPPQPPARLVPSSPGSLSSSSQPLFIFPRGGPSAPCPGPPDPQPPPPGAPAAPGAPRPTHRQRAPWRHSPAPAALRQHGATASAPPLGPSSASSTPDAGALAQAGGARRGGARAELGAGGARGKGGARALLGPGGASGRGGRAAVSGLALSTVSVALVPAAAVSLCRSPRDLAPVCALAPFAGVVTARGGRP